MLKCFTAEETAESANNSLRGEVTPFALHTVI